MRVILNLLILWSLSGGWLLAGGSSSTQFPLVDEARQRELAVAFVIVEGVFNTELVAPFDVFQHTVFHARPGMKVFTVAPEKKPVVTFEGLKITPDYEFSDAPKADVLVVPSAEHSMDSDLENERLIQYVKQAGRASGYVVSLCDGAFVLARAGLLEQRRLTTFPADIEQFRRMFPALAVIEEVSFVHDGPALTSVGGARSFDAALYLVEVLYGKEAARKIGRGLVIDWDLNSVAHLIVGTS